MAELTRWHRAWFVAAALAAALVAGVCLLLPQHAGAVLPIVTKPLHTRCVGAMYLAAAIAMVMSWHEGDIAAVRIPMVLTSCGAATLALAAATLRPLPWGWLVAHAVVAGTGAWLWWFDESLQAPAERPDRGLLLLAALVAASALALALAPQQATALWPWPMPMNVAPFYAAPLLAIAVATWLLARERRRDARRITLWSLVACCGALLTASMLHLASFAGTSAALWFVLLAATLALLLHRLLRRTRPAL